MRPSDIRDPSLRAWAQQHVEASLKECKERKVSSDYLTDSWKGYSEGDWGALRELIPLRQRCKELDIERTAQELAIARRIRSLPKIVQHGTSYDHPYSLGLEVSVLRELLESRPGAFTETIAFDVGPLTERFRPR